MKIKTCRKKKKTSGSQSHTRPQVKPRRAGDEFSSSLRVLSAVFSVLIFSKRFSGDYDDGVLRSRRYNAWLALFLSSSFLRSFPFFLCLVAGTAIHVALIVGDVLSVLGCSFVLVTWFVFKARARSLPISSSQKASLFLLLLLFCALFCVFGYLSNCVHSC